MAHHHPSAGGKGINNRHALAEMPARAIFVIIKEFVRCHSTSRNPLIFRMFTRMHLVESVGTGIPRIARILSEDGFPPAEYKTEGFFTTILRKKKTSSTEQSDQGSGKSSVESSVKTSVKIKEMMQSNPKVSLREIAEAIGISTRAIEKAVNKLTEEGEIDHKGPKKGGEWIVNK